jgi:hypothetical protein
MAQQNDRHIRDAFDKIVNPQQKKKKRASKKDEESSHRERVTERRIKKLIRGVSRG